MVENEDILIEFVLFDLVIFVLRYIQKKSVVTFWISLLNEDLIKDV